MNPKANHYAKHKPTVVLMDFPSGEDKLKGYPEGLSAIADDDGKPVVFANFSKAAKYVSRNLDPALQQYVNYVNETPQKGAGDREATHNKRCLKCGGFLRPSGEAMAQAVGDSEVYIEEFVCPVCDLGEKPDD